MFEPEQFPGLSPAQREAIADAHLIAAAPDLLAACEAALPHHQGGHSVVGRALRDAIAKAQGGRAQGALCANRDCRKPVEHHSRRRGGDSVVWCGSPECERVRTRLAKRAQRERDAAKGGDQ